MANYDQRRENYYGHQGHNLKSRDELKKRGVKDGTPNLPSMDATHHGAEKRLAEGDRMRSRRNTLNTATPDDVSAQQNGFGSAAEAEAAKRAARARGKGGFSGTKGKTTPPAPPPKKKPAGRSLLDALNGK